jgi:hypothetical protein
MGRRGRVTRDAFVSLILWEKSIQISSSMSQYEILAALKSETVLRTNWRRLNRYTSRCPLVGEFSDSGGTVRTRDFYPSLATARQLKFELRAEDSSTKLIGVLQLRSLLVLYEAFCLVGMLFLQAVMIYGLWKYGRSNARAWLQVLQEFGLVPFCWLYVRMRIWLSRKREARLLALVGRLIKAEPFTLASTWLRG